MGSVSTGPGFNILADIIGKVPTTVNLAGRLKRESEDGLVSISWSRLICLVLV